MPVLSRRALLIGGTALAAAATAPPTLAIGNPATSGGSRHHRPDRDVLRGWARDTWASLVAMTDDDTGLSADNIDGPITSPNRSGYTSPTNIGGYLWSAIVARDLGIIGSAEALRRLHQTLDTLADLDRHEPSGMFFNWYDERTTEVLTTWPDGGNPVDPFLSSVDNGWLAAAFVVLGNAGDRSVARKARALLRPMRFDAFYNPTPPGHAVGLLRGGFWPERPDRTDIVEGDYLGTGQTVYYTGFHYDTTVSETRIASYLGISLGQIPREHYFGPYRTLPATCDWDWHESQPIGSTRSYLGVEVFEGAYPYRDFFVVPGWGGSMFEALMPNVFVPEERWAPRSWGVNHPLMVRAHREHGLDEAKYGFWGFSPASDPTKQPGDPGYPGYREYGVDAVGLKSNGYFSDVEETDVDGGFGDCRAGTNPDPSYGDGVVTPHAAFLAMMHEPRAAYDNLRRLADAFPCYADGGFYDAVAVGSGRVAKRYLSLDQAMIMGVLGNVLGRGILRQAFTRGAIERSIRPLIGMETFSARP